MADNLNSIERRRAMERVRSVDTTPEVAVRRLLHGLGYRFRLHRADLPGRPDIVLASRNTVVFVHGCFWHGHHCKRGMRLPRTNAAYWKRKLTRNALRDRANIKRLRRQGWCVIVVWECHLREPERVCRRLSRLLEVRVK